MFGESLLCNYDICARITSRKSINDYMLILCGKEGEYEKIYASPGGTL